MNAEQTVRDVLLDTTAVFPFKPMQDMLFAAGLIITDHAFNLAYRLRVW